jgi:Ca2+-binding EF-hand superfamily protein
MYTEFLACTLEARGPINQCRILEAFEQIDRSNKGHLTQEDLCCILPKSITDKYIRSLFNRASMDGNAGLSFEMFLAAINNGN